MASPMRALITDADLPQALVPLFENFEALFAAAPHRLSRQIGGDTVEVATALPSYLNTVRNAWSDVSAPTGADPQCRILVAVAGEAGVPHPPQLGEAYYHELAVDARLNPTRWRMHHMAAYGFWQIFDRVTGRGLQLHRAADAPNVLPPWDGGAPLRNFLHWHFMRSGRVLIHAGSLGHEGEGILLVGAGGSGKSGTVLAGLLNGLQSVGDDYLLAERSNEVMAWPLFPTLKQDPAGYKRLGLSRFPKIDTALNWQGKHQFGFNAIGALPPPAAMRMHAMCLPSVSNGDETCFEPISGKDIFLALAPSGIMQMPGDRGGTFAFCAALARQLPAYRMVLGTDPEEITRAISAFLKEHSNQC